MSDNNQQADYTIKIVVAGNSGVGKTNLIQRYVLDIFDEDSSPTVGVDFQKKKVNIENKLLSVQFWDTVGQEKLRAIANSYYKNADGVIMVYDITDKESFERLSFWLDEIKNSAPKDIRFILLGNKNDLVEERTVSEEEGLDWAKENNLYYMEVSAKTNADECVNKALDILFREILKEMQSNQQKSQKNIQGQTLRNKTISNIEENLQQAQLSNEDGSSNNKSKCC